MKIIVRVDAGPGIGLARLSRGEAMAAALADAGTDVSFAIHGGAPAPAGYDSIALPVASGAAHVEALAGAASDAEIIVIDAPGVRSLELIRLRRALPDARLIVIDDYADGYLPAHAIVNPNPHAYLCRYDTAMDTRTVLGAPFALVRPDVVFARDRAVDSGAWPRVVVSPGAFDADGAARVVAALDALSDPFTLVVTASVDAPGAGAMREAAASNHHPTTIVLSPEDVGATYAGAAVGVCTSPVTAAEFACLGVPGVYLPRNARDASAFAVLGRMGAGVAAGRAGAFDADGLSRVVRAMLRPNGPRSTLAKNARALVDGKGAARALGKLSKYNVLPLAVPDIP